MFTVITFLGTKCLIIYSAYHGAYHIMSSQWMTLEWIDILMNSQCGKKRREACFNTMYLKTYPLLQCQDMYAISRMSAKHFEKMLITECRSRLNPVVTNSDTPPCRLASFFSCQSRLPTFLSGFVLLPY